MCRSPRRRTGRRPEARAVSAGRPDHPHRADLVASRAGIRGAASGNDFRMATTQRRTGDWLLAALLFLLPVIPSVVVMEATSRRNSANIGGGMLLIAAIGVGSFWAWTGRRRSFSWITLVTGLAVLIAVAAFTFGGQALER